MGKELDCRSHILWVQIVGDDKMAELATKIAVPQSSSWNLRVDGEADPVAIPICSKFGEFQDTKSNAYIFSPPNDSPIHLIPIKNPFLKLALVDWILKDKNTHAQEKTSSYNSAWNGGHKALTLYYPL